MRLTLSIVLLALIVTSIWLFGDDSTAGVVLKSPPDSVIEPKEPEAEQRSTSTESAAQEQVTVQPEEVSTRKAINALPSGPVGELTVLRFGSDQPIEGAEVGYFTTNPDFTALSTEERHSMNRGDIEFYRAHGYVQKTDSNGKCSLSLQQHGVSYIVAFEDLYGSGYLRADKLADTVRLKVDRELVLHVQDAAGRPAEGVTIVALREGLPQGPQRWQLGKTDEEGQYTQYHIQDYAGDEQNHGLSFFAMGVGLESESVEVDVLSARVVHATLTMPRAGTITFELLTEAGKPFDHSGYEQPSISLSTHDSKPGKRESFSTARFGAHLFGPDSRAVIRYVALDKYYAARMRRLVGTPLTGEGPTARTPDIVVSIVVPSETVVFKGRVVDPDGAPLAGKHLHLICMYDAGMAGDITTTGKDGEFLLAMPHFAAGKTVELSGLIRRGGEPNLSYRREGPWTILAGSNDVGEIVFAESPVLLTGRLVVPQTLESTQRLGWQIELKKGKRWQQRDNLETLWHEDRRFELRGEFAEGSRLRLRFQPGTHLPLEPLEFTAGTKDIEITLAAASTASATFLIDDVAHQGVLQAYLESEVQKEPTDLRHRMMRRMMSQYRLHRIADGRLQASWTGLQSGTYQLRVEFSGASEPLVSISGIQVGSGEVEDPRLIDIDLRGLLRQIEIRLTDEQGQPFTQDDTIVYLANAEGTDWHGHRPQSGKVKITIMDAAMIRVLAQGHTLEMVDDVRADHEIVVKRAPAVRFVVKWPFALPAGITPQLELTPTIPGTTRKTRARIGGSSGGLENRTVSMGDIDTEGHATVHPMVLGKQKVRIAMDPNGRGYYMYPRTWRSVEVTGKETEVIEIQVSEAELRRSLDRMKKR